MVSILYVFLPLHIASLQNTTSRYSVINKKQHNHNIRTIPKSNRKSKKKVKSIPITHKYMTNYFPDSKKLITELNNHSLTRCYMYIRIKIPLFDNYEIVSHIYELYLISTISSLGACVGSGGKQFWSNCFC